VYGIVNWFDRHKRNDPTCECDERNRSTDH
jgi:hypothetical protein